MIKKRNKKGQFYLVATIIIVALVISLSVIFNYSNKADYSNIQETAKELSIESEKVLDYGLATSDDKFEDFSMRYSEYAGEDKDIYFIIVDQSKSIAEAYKYSEGIKVPLNGDLVVGSSIVFTLDSRNYNFKLEEGKNFYFIVIYDKGGERYVYTG